MPPDPACMCIRHYRVTVDPAAQQRAVRAGCDECRGRLGAKWRAVGRNPGEFASRRPAVSCVAVATALIYSAPAPCS